MNEADLKSLSFYKLVNLRDRAKYMFVEAPIGADSGERDRFKAFDEELKRRIAVLVRLGLDQPEILTMLNGER